LTQLPEYEGFDVFQQEHREAVGFAVQYELIADKHAAELDPPEKRESEAADQSVIPPHALHVEVS
jgi:hypothetical protein